MNEWDRLSREHLNKMRRDIKQNPRVEAKVAKTLASIGIILDTDSAERATEIA